MRRTPRASLRFVWLLPWLLAGQGCITYHNYTTQEQEQGKISSPVEWKGGYSARVYRGTRDVEVSGLAPRDVRASRGTSTVELYLLNGAAQMELAPGLEPPAFLEQCESDGGSPTECIEELTVWGLFLLDNPIAQLRLRPEQAEKELGARYLQSALRENAGRLRSLPAGSLDRVDLGIWGDSPTAESVPAHLLPLLVDHFRALWRAVPAAPSAREPFLAKLQIGEWLKDLYLAVVDQGEAADKATLQGAPQFFDEALAFHQLPAPFATENDEEYIEVLLVRGAIYRGIGYARLPGKTGLQPLQALVETDMGIAFSCLQLMAAQKWISEADAEARMADLGKKAASAATRDLTERIEEARRGGDRLGTAELLTELANVHQMLGDKEAAADDLRSAADEVAGIGNQPVSAQIAVALATAHLDAQRPQLALETVRSVLPRILDTMGFWDVDLMNQALAVEQKALTDLGRPEEASRALAEHTAKLQPLQDSAAKLQAILDEPEPSRMQAALEAWASRLDPASFLAVRLHLLLVGVKKDLGQWDEAAALARQVLPAAERWFGPAIELYLLGELLEIERQRGEFGTFLELLEKFERLSRISAGESWRAPHERMLARVFYHLGEYDRAEEALQIKRQRDRAELLANPSLEGGGPDDEDLILLARIRLENGKREEALALIEDIESRSLDALDDRPVKNATREVAGLRLLSEIAEVEAAAGRPQAALEALAPVLKAVEPAAGLDQWTEVMIRAAELRLELQQSQDETIRKFEEIAPQILEFPELNPINSARLDLFLGRYYRAGNQPDLGRERLLRALATAERSAAIDEQILAQQGLGDLAHDAGDLETAAQRYQAAVDLLRAVSEKIPSDTSKIGYRSQRTRAIPLLAVTHFELFQQTGEPAHLERMLEVVEEGKARALTEMLLRKQGEIATPVIDVRALRAALPAGATVIEYYVPDDRVFRLSWDRTRIQVEPLAITSEELEQRVLQAREEVTRDRGLDEAAFRQKSQELTALLLPEEWLVPPDPGAPPRHLFVVPTGSLHLLPLALLVDRQGNYFDDRLDLVTSTLPSASVLLRKQPKAAESRRSAAYVNPALDGDHHDFLSSVPDVQQAFETSVQQWGQATVVWEEPRTPAAFLSEARGLDNVFLYAHARFLPDQPMSSYVRLGGSADASPLLTAGELVGESLGRGLWVIAGCSTGAGKIRAGDEVLGLPRALLQAGPTMVVVSLWDVDVATSLETMASFYLSLAKGRSTAEALRLARAEIRRAGKPPFDWAPFVLIGFHDFAR